jgi:tetratricopeptide (TPR) repeat protein
MAFCLRQLGVLGYYQGAHDKAHRLLTEGLEVSRALGSAWAIAYSLVFLSMAAYGRGAYAEAEKLLEEGLALSTEVGDRFTTAYALNGLGLVKRAQGNLQAARQLMEDSIAIWREIGDQESLANSLFNLGDALLGTEDQPDARTYFLEALSVASQAQLAPLMLGALLGCAILQAEGQQIQSALNILICIKDHPANIQFVKVRAEKLFTELQAKLSVEQMDFIAAGVNNKTLDALVQETLAYYHNIK